MWETIIVIVVVGAAVVGLGVAALRSLRGRGGCAHCTKNCHHAGRPDTPDDSSSCNRRPE